MTSLAFQILEATAEPHAAVPTVLLRTRASETDGRGIHALALRCQIRIEPRKRSYNPDEERRLYELFGETPQWGDSLRPFLWTHVSATLGGFEGATEFDLPLECTYDFEVAAAKYIHALGEGAIPLILLFSGTVFPRAKSGFVAEPVSWGVEATFRLPVATWRSTMDLYFPNGAWIRMRRETLDRLQRYRVLRALPTWDLAFEHLLKEAAVDDL